MQMLTVNVGSSSIKLSLFAIEAGIPPQVQAQVAIEDIGQAPIDDHLAGLSVALEKIQASMPLDQLDAIGYRVVFGGPKLQTAQLITSDVLSELERFAGFDADHMPYILQVIRSLQKRFANARHVACFDSAFFVDLPRVTQLLPIPRKYYDAGIRKYGYHGLSYEYILSALRESDASAADGKVIIAHLGSGVSLAATVGGKPVDTTMSFTPTSGIPMSSRSGDLDPSVAHYLMSNAGLSLDDYVELVNHQSGLLGMSETTADMQQLLQTQTGDERAADAVASFCYNVRKAIGNLSAALGGLDTLVFSGGIGERSAEIRGRVCQELRYLGIELDNERNDNNAAVVSKDDTIPVRVIHTDEALTIVRETQKVLAQAT